MATRTERVVLTLQDDLTPGLARAAAATALLDKSLERLDRSAVSTQRSTQQAQKGVTALGQQTRAASADLNTFTGRLGLLSTAAAALGPSLVPIAASAVPAIGALATGMVGASAAAGTLLLAFQGVGDAVSAVSDYQLAPTAENLAKVQAAFEEIGPSGARFVMALREMQPVLDDLQQASRDGIFPGFERGLDALIARAPEVISFVEDISRRVGDMGGDIGQALANDEDWREFFAFIDSEAGPSLEDFGRATGNFVAGVANMVEALSGLSGGVSGDLLESSRAFREWAAGMEDTEGFQEFADYIRTNGPAVGDFLSSTADALLALATAIAPWGQVVLPILTVAADAFAALASSPIGPPLFIAATALLAVSKASALLGPNLTRANAAIGTTRASISGFGRDVRVMSTEFGNLGRAHSTALSFFSGTSAAAKRTRESLREIAPTAAAAGAGIAAVGALSTGAADKVGLTNTATLTLAGSMAGPWGAAVGAGVGLLLDFSSANNDAQKAVDALGQALDSGEDFDALSKKLEEAEKKVQAYKKSLEFEGLANGGSMSEFWDQFWGNSKEPLSNQAEENTEALKKARREIEELGKQQVIDDSVAGRTDAVGEAIRRLGEDAISTAASANELSAALEGLLSPEQDLIGAQDQMSSVLNGLKEQVDATNKSLTGTSDAAIKNRAAISEGVTAISELTAAQAAAGASSLEVALTMDEQRSALIRQAAAAGLSKQQTEALINQMGLTPDVVRTAFEAAGIEGVDAKTQALTARYHALPKRLQTDIATNGIPKSEADISRLQAKYKLTPAQVRTLAALRDNASGPIAGILAALRNLDGQSATTTVTNRTINEIITISRGQSTRPDRRIEPNADGGFYAYGTRSFADGGWGSNGRYYSRTAQIIPGGANILWGEKETGWEAYISGKPSERERNLQVLSMAADRLGAAVTPFANGGMAGRDPVAAALWQSGHRDPNAALIAGLTVRQLARLGRAFDDLSGRRLSRLGRAMERAADLQEKQTERARDRFEKVRDRRRDLGSSIADGLRGDLWSDAGGSAFGKQFASGSIGAVNAQLRAERDQAKQFSKDIALLRKKGLNGAALEEIIATGDADRARMFASGSVSALRSYEAAYNARQSATAAAGRLGGAVLTPEYSALKAQLDRQVAEQQATNRQLAALRKEQKQQHDASQKSRKDNGAGPAARRGARGRG